MYRSSPFRSTLNTGCITALNLCEVCTEAVQRSVGHVWRLHRSSPLRRILNKGYIIYSFGHVWSMHRSSPFCSTLNTRYITALDRCEVCTEAVHSVALWTRFTSQIWTCVKYVPEQSTAKHFVWTRVTSEVWTCVRYVPKQSSPYSTLNMGYITALDMCEVCAEAVHCAALWTRFTWQLWTRVKLAPTQSTP